MSAKAAIVAIRKLGKREAQRRLAVLGGASRGRKAPVGRRKGGARDRVRATTKR